MSGFGWRFKFNINIRRGDIGSTVPEWFDTLLPFWDDVEFFPDAGYTTAFLLERPVAEAQSTNEDLERIASPNDPTPLAVLALRGLEQVRVCDVVWDLSVDDGVIEVRCSDRETTWRWMSFVSIYRPDDDAMRRFLEVRQEIQDQIDNTGQRVERKVVGLLPLDEDGLPKPPNNGRVYATLPTQVQVPFGFHLQADWLVNIDRQNLREIEDDPWQETIVRQIPEIVRQLFEWLSGESEATRSSGYRALGVPSTDDGLLSKPIKALRDDFIWKLGDQKVVPIYGVNTRQFRTPQKISRLPSQFRDDFGGRPQWRPDLLFGLDLMDEGIAGSSSYGICTLARVGRRHRSG